MHVLSRRKARPRGNADRAVRVSVREPRSARGKPVEIRRTHDVVSGAAEHALVVLVGQDEEEVGGLHKFLQRSFGASRLRAQPRAYAALAATHSPTPLLRRFAPSGATPRLCAY